MDSNDQTILANFYNSLTSKRNFDWNVMNDLCGQFGILCDSSKRIYQLYSIFFVIQNKQNFDINNK